MILDLFRKFFLVKEIISKQGVVHFRRWRLLQLSFFAIYIHQIFQSDADAHSHNHPWGFISFILNGGYLEENSKGVCIPYTTGSIIHHSAEEFHKIKLIRPTTSLVFTYGKPKSWGFLVDGNVVDNLKYRKLKDKANEKSVVY